MYIRGIDRGFVKKRVNLKIYYMNLLSIYYLLKELTITVPFLTSCFSNILIIRYFFANSLSIRFLSHDFTINFANILLIYYLLREFTMNEMSFSRIKFRFCECAISPEYRMNSLFQFIFPKSFFPNCLLSRPVAVHEPS